MGFVANEKLEMGFQGFKGKCRQRTYTDFHGYDRDGCRIRRRDTIGRRWEIQRVRRSSSFCYLWKHVEISSWHLSSGRKLFNSRNGKELQVFEEAIYMIRLLSFGSLWQLAFMDRFRGNGKHTFVPRERREHRIGWWKRHLFVLCAF